ncbi:ABC transporter permease [Leifsonia shinshuensis]|uniref:Putative ABC transport system permease protein n=1 Tax=Leifsonia shinshuensis TaxID=150026 RepID=A0A853CQC1_9MICO|nr:ABC transporter permease [Leifsonia shinshuensis]NYJ22123.1 putative ABC transport system permease protein [Leifsonia shinshuensis]
MPIVRELAPTLLGVALLALLATAVLGAYRVPHRWAPLLAILRGAAQLAVISVVLSGVITSPWWVALALLVMFGVAAGTATRRIGWSVDHGTMMAVAMAAGVVVTFTIVFSTGAIDFTARYALAIGGIVIGNSMSIATLSGRRFTEAVDDHWDEVEGWLALGASPRQSTIEQARTAVYSALIPSVDQTKTTGLVTLPGAFVGAIFGGVSPLEAGRFQVVVLAAIMCAGSITAVIVAAWLAPVRVRPARLR